jgi:flagellar protein FliO/FliZ
MKYLINTIKHSIYLFLLIPLQVISAEEKAISSVNTDPMSGGYLLQLILGLIVVIICIVALAWITKRVNRLQSSGDGYLKVLGGLSMSARERVVLLQVGEQQLLVGVSPGRINTLHVLDSPVTGSDKTSNAGSFSEKLSTMLNDSLKNKSVQGNS